MLGIEKLALICLTRDFCFFLFTSPRELYLPRYFGDCAFFPCPPHAFAELTPNRHAIFKHQGAPSCISLYTIIKTNVKRSLKTFRDSIQKKAIKSLDNTLSAHEVSQSYQSNKATFVNDW